MREIRLYGSEGGGAAALPTPIILAGCLSCAKPQISLNKPIFYTMRTATFLSVMLLTLVETGSAQIPDWRKVLFVWVNP